MMNKQGSEVSSVTVTKIAPPLHDKFFKPELMQEKMFHYFLLAHEKVNKVCRVFPFLREPGTSYWLKESFKKFKFRGPQEV